MRRFRGCPNDPAARGLPGLLACLCPISIAPPSESRSRTDQLGALSQFVPSRRVADGTNVPAFGSSLPRWGRSKGPHRLPRLSGHPQALSRRAFLWAHVRALRLGTRTETPATAPGHKPGCPWAGVPRALHMSDIRDNPRFQVRNLRSILRAYRGVNFDPRSMRHVRSTPSRPSAGRRSAADAAPIRGNESTRISQERRRAGGRHVARRPAQRGSRCVSAARSSAPAKHPCDPRGSDASAVLAWGRRDR